MSSQNESMTAAEYRNETQSEEDIHKAVVEWADRQAGAKPALELLFHVPNGGSRHIAEATKLKAMGTRQGVPDLLLPVPRLGGHDKACERIEYNGLALELKSPSGRLRATQAWWLQQLQESDWAVAVAWTFSEARHILRSYLDSEPVDQKLDLTIAEAPGHVD
jgi:hypothetical protein